jgi:hypothetical protein
LVLSEDQSDRPISNLEAEMSEATNMRVLSFAQDLITATLEFATSRRMPFGMLELSPTLQSVWRNFSSSTEPVRCLAVHPDLHVQGFQLVILMRYDSFCFDYQTTPSALATTYKKNPKY